jgi:hypothetical protein
MPFAALFQFFLCEGYLYFLTYMFLYSTFILVFFHIHSLQSQQPQGSLDFNLQITWTVFVFALHISFVYVIYFSVRPHYYYCTHLFRCHFLIGQNYFSLLFLSVHHYLCVVKGFSVCVLKVICYFFFLKVCGFFYA